MGTLVGGILGRRSLSVTTGTLFLYGRGYALSFLLVPVASSVPTPSPTPSPSPAPTPPPAVLDFHGTTGFGYTVVDLTEHFQLMGGRIGLGVNGGVYQVSGQMTAHTLIPPWLSPTGKQTDETWVFQVSGTYDPISPPARFGLTMISGGPMRPGDSPWLTATRIGPKTLNCVLGGIPSHGINALGFSA